jgi:hypothetical protein
MNFETARQGTAKKKWLCFFAFRFEACSLRDTYLATTADQPQRCTMTAQAAR